MTRQKIECLLTQLLRSEIQRTWLQARAPPPRRPRSGGRAAGRCGCLSRWSPGPLSGTCAPPPPLLRAHGSSRCSQAWTWRFTWGPLGSAENLPCIDGVRPVLLLAVEVVHGGGVQVGVAADCHHGPVVRQDGEEAVGEELGAKVVGGHHSLQTLRSLLSSSNTRAKSSCRVVDDHVNLAKAWLLCLSEMAPCRRCSWSSLRTWPPSSCWRGRARWGRPACSQWP